MLSLAKNPIALYYPRKVTLSSGLKALIEDFINSFLFIQNDSDSHPEKMAVHLQERFIYLIAVYKKENNLPDDKSLSVDIFKEDVATMFRLIRDYPTLPVAVKEKLVDCWDEDPAIFLALGIESIQHQTSAKTSIEESENQPVSDITSAIQIEKNIKRFKKIQKDCYEYSWLSPEQFANMTEAQFYQLENKAIQEIYRKSDLTIEQILNLTPRQFQDITTFLKQFIGSSMFPPHNNCISINEALNLTDVQRRVICDSEFGVFNYLYNGKLKIKEALSLTIEHAIFIKQEIIQSHIRYALLTLANIVKQITDPHSAINHPYIKHLITVDRLTRLQALTLSKENCSIFCRKEVRHEIDSGTLFAQDIYTKITNDKSSFNSVLIQDMIKSKKLSYIRALGLNQNQEHALLLHGKKSLKLSASELNDFLQEHND